MRRETQPSVLHPVVPVCLDCGNQDDRLESVFHTTSHCGVQDPMRFAFALAWA